MKTTTESVKMLVSDKVSYDTKKARQDALTAVRKHLGVCYSSAGDGWFHVESWRVQLAPKKTPNVRAEAGPTAKRQARAVENA